MTMITGLAAELAVMRRRRVIGGLAALGAGAADGSNGIGGTVSNVLAEAGVQRGDIRSSFGRLTAVADGIALTINLQLGEVGGACAPLGGGGRCISDTAMRVGNIRCMRRPRRIICGAWG